MLETLDEFLQSIWSKILDFIFDLINIIPAPESVDQIITSLNTIVSYAAYPAYLAALDYAIPTMATAFFVRFVIRRIPIIG